jgi:predicted ribosome quality control (RQC) complex YloA/Tae2 family protein
MATQQGMSSIDIRTMLYEIRDRLPLWIGKIYQYNTDSFGFRLNGEDKSKYNFLVECGRRAHLTENLPDAPQNPSGYSMFLRKYISGGRVLDIRQYGLQRIFIIKIGKTEKEYNLVFELFNEGNAVLCDENFIVINPLKRLHFRDREIVSGTEYIFPESGTDDITIESIRTVLENSERDLVRTLASDFLLGGRYAEEVCRIAGYDKTMNPVEADPQTILNALEGLLSRGTNAVITKSGCWPYPLPGEEPVSSFSSFNDALSEYFPLPQPAVKDAKKEKLPKSEIIRRRQQEAIVNFEKKIAELQVKVDAIYENYQNISGIIDTLRDASSKLSWQEIEETLKNSSLPAAKSIVRIYPSESAVDVMAGGKKVKIFINENPESNANRYYGEIKKYKKKKAGALIAMEKFMPKEKPAKKRQEYKPQKKKWYHKYRWFTTSDGVLVIGGQDAGSNEDIGKKYLEGGDYFVHADVHGGSVVVTKGETERWDEVAEFAASYSNAWKAGHFNCDVYAAKPEQVSKTAESGEFVKRGAFIIRGERRYFRNVGLKIAIGLQLEPELAVIGGPESAVKRTAAYYAVLLPGKFEPNDTAKKVLRELKKMIPEEDIKDLKTVLNTESIAAFVPPGGSDIVEVVDMTKENS